MSNKFHQLSYPTVVVIGGGFAGLQIAKRLHNKPYKVLVLDKNNFHTFQPLLYQVATGGLGSDAIAYPLRKIIGPMRNVAFRMATVIGINTHRNEVMTNVGNFAYDHLIIATGAVTNYFGKANVEKYAMSLKEISESLDLRSNILQEFERVLLTKTITNVQPPLNFVIVGGGPTGVELAGAMAEIKNNVVPSDFTELDPNLINIYLIEASLRLLSAMPEKLSEVANQDLQKMGVHTLLNTVVTDYDGQTLFLNNGEHISTGTVVWAAGVKGNIVEGLKNAQIVKGNRFKTNEFHLVEGYTNIYAIGDAGAIISDEYPFGHPMMASVAVQQGYHISNNLIRLAQNKPMRPFVYNDKGTMATIGRNKAVVHTRLLDMKGFFAWLVWMFVHLMLLVGFRNRFVTLLNWAWSYFTYKGAIRLIIRPYTSKYHISNKSAQSEHYAKSTPIEL